MILRTAEGGLEQACTQENAGAGDTVSMLCGKCVKLVPTGVSISMLGDLGREMIPTSPFVFGDGS